MSEQQAGIGKTHFLLLFCLLLAAILSSGCSHLNGAFQARSAFEEANTLFSQGSYQASLDRYKRIGEQHPLARDRVLFEMGIIYAYPKNDQRDYQQALQTFQQLINDYPDSEYRHNSATMIFTINNVALKDRVIDTQQAKIDALQQEVKGSEDKVRALQSQNASLEQKYMSILLRESAADKILIEKTQRRLSLLAKGEVLKTYKIALGGNPIGPKERQGDNKTPEGTYVIDSRNSDSRYHLSLRISYPNESDKRRASELGVSPGGDIMIHGLKNGFSWVGDRHAEVDWTQGCIAVTDEEIKEIAKLAPNGTVVEIRP